MSECGRLGTPGVLLGTAAAFALGAVLLLASASVAHADPFTITGGTASGDDSGGSMTVSGSGFQFSLSGESTGEVSNLGSLFCPHPCDPAGVDFTALLSGFLGSGSAQIGATSYSNIDFHGFLDFEGGETTVTHNSTGGGVVEGPFAFAGLFNGFQGGVQLFSHTLTGQGLASLRFLSGNAVESTLLTFDEQAPVPEPGTLLLLATGAAGIAARRRRRLLGDRQLPG